MCSEDSPNKYFLWLENLLYVPFIYFFSPHSLSFLNSKWCRRSFGIHVNSKATWNHACWFIVRYTFLYKKETILYHNLAHITSFFSWSRLAYSSVCERTHVQTDGTLILKITLILREVFAAGLGNQYLYCIYMSWVTLLEPACGVGWAKKWVDI